MLINKYLAGIMNSLLDNVFVTTKVKPVLLVKYIDDILSIVKGGWIDLKQNLKIHSKNLENWLDIIMQEENCNELGNDICKLNVVVRRNYLQKYFDKKLGNDNLDGKQ